MFKMTVIARKMEVSHGTYPDLFLFTAAKNYGHKLYITKENKERLGLIVDHF